jgi:hypothetical protein
MADPQNDPQLMLPEMVLQIQNRDSAAPKRRKIPHKAILASLQGPIDEPKNIVGIYRLRVLPVKTRTIQLLGRKGPARITQTLLGYEVQGSYKRIQCPDMITARYLKLFLEIGCRTIKLPYDPTVTAAIVPKLEECLATLQAAIRQAVPESPKLQHYVIRQIFRYLRAQLKSHPEPVPAQEQPE